MAKASNPAHGKPIGDLDEETREQEESKHWKKHNDLDNMILNQRRKAERMERINPIVQDEYVLTLEEVEEIEKDLPEEFDDTHIEKAFKKKNIDVTARKQKAKQDREEFKKQINDKIFADAMAKSQKPTDPS